MDDDLGAQSKEVNGINLDNYFPFYHSHNSVVYYHKKFLQETQGHMKVDKKHKIIKERGKRKKEATGKQHKGQQFDSDDVGIETGCYIPVLENGVKLNKFMPLLIPTAKESESEPICYTIKTKKIKKQNKKSPRAVEKNLTFNKDKLNMDHLVKGIKNKTHGISARESLDPYSQNTLDDLHLNINQSSSFSEMSGLKCKKQKEKNNNNSSCKYLVSNSFDALATESMSGNCNRIKIQLMNESDKNIFSDSIKKPVLNVIKEYLAKNANNNHVDAGLTELKSMQKVLKYNNQKLDMILQKLTCLEAKIDYQADQITKPDKSPHLEYTCKASKLEDLSEAFSEMKEEKTSDEDLSEDLEIRKKRIKTKNKSVVVMMDDNGKDSGKKGAVGCGEEVPTTQDVSSSMSQLGIKPDRPNRIPARFCWTDAERLK